MGPNFFISIGGLGLVLIVALVATIQWLINRWRN